MLSKKICQKCYEYYDWPWESAQNNLMVPRDDGPPWPTSQRIMCLSRETLPLHIARTNEPPPEWCPFSLEHVLEMQDGS